MGRWRIIAIFVLCLPLRAQLFRTVNVPNAGPDARLELSVGLWKATAAPGDVISTTAAGWHVTIEFDAVHCAVYCTYRRTRDPGLLPPPVTTIRVFAGGAAKPVMAVVDPAGVVGPRAASRERAQREEACAGSKRLLVAAPVPHAEQQAQKARLLAHSVASVDTLVCSSAPLRI